MIRIFQWPLLSMIWFYRTFISPLFVPTCRFYPTCSHYARTAIKRHGVFVGSGLTLKRLAKCHPWGDQGCDPVPDVRSKK